MDSEVFYSPAGESGSRRRRREARAKAVCAACPVLRECARYALAIAEPHGVWGGMSEGDRALVAHSIAERRRTRG
jgi:WhiB family redox-sensing transcriptional regulator